MSDETCANQAFYSAPTRSQRFWRWAGFHYHRGDDPPGTEGLQFTRTDMGFHFRFADRLRLLFSGKLLIRSDVYGTPLPENPQSRMDWCIRPPGSDFP